MTRQYKDLRASLKRVILNIGDIVIDNSGGHVGILIKRRRHIDIIRDDIYVWEIVWSPNAVSPVNPHNAPNSRYMEEWGLKMSVVASLYEWHTIHKIIYPPND